MGIVARCCGLLLALLGVFSANAEERDPNLFILTAPPRESPERAREIYEPLARLLTQQLGIQVKYEQPFDWMDYSTRMRGDYYDIIFDGPHFAAWRMKHLQHAAVARLPGNLSFVIIGRDNDVRQARMRDILNGRLCGLASPNLGTLAVLSEFTNPIVQPDLYEVDDISTVYQLFQSGACRSAVVQEKFYRKLPDTERKNLRIIYTSDSFPEQTVTVSRRVTDRQRAVLAELLTRPSGIEGTQELLRQFSKQAKSFVKARPTDYAGLEDLLEGVVWGW